MSSDNGDHAKRRRVDNGVGSALSAGPESDGASRGDDGQGENGFVARELMSMMNKLLDQNRSTERKMLEETKIMRGEMKSMQKEIMQLRGKCDTMEKSLLSAMDSRFDDVDSRFDDAEDKFRDVDNNQKYQVLLKTQKWEYSAPYPNSLEI